MVAERNSGTAEDESSNFNPGSRGEPGNRQGDQARTAPHDHGSMVVPPQEFNFNTGTQWGTQRQSNYQLGQVNQLPQVPEVPQVPQVQQTPQALQDSQLPQVQQGYNQLREYETSFRDFSGYHDNQFTRHNPQQYEQSQQQRDFPTINPRASSYKYFSPQENTQGNSSSRETMEPEPQLSRSVRKTIQHYPSLVGKIDLGINPEGQMPPAGLRPRIKTEAWPEEGTLYISLELKGGSIIRRVDNNLINGTKLLNYTGISRGRRDGILKQERVRHVVRMGNQDLKGVWIPFERAYEIAREHGILDALYPLFIVHLEKFLYSSRNVIRTQQVVRAAEKVNESFGQWMWGRPHTPLSFSQLDTPRVSELRDDPSWTRERSSSSLMGPRHHRGPSSGRSPLSPTQERRPGGQSIPPSHRRQYSIDKKRRAHEHAQYLSSSTSRGFRFGGASDAGSDMPLPQGNIPWQYPSSSGSGSGLGITTDFTGDSGDSGMNQECTQDPPRPPSFMPQYSSLVFDRNQPFPSLVSQQRFQEDASGSHTQGGQTSHQRGQRGQRGQQGQRGQRDQRGRGSQAGDQAGSHTGSHG